MRVLITTDAVGGVWTFTQQLAQTLLSQCHYVAVVNVGPMPSDSQRGWCVRQSATYGPQFLFEAAGGALEWMDNNRRAYLHAEPLLLRVMDTFQPDIFLSGQFCFGRIPVSIPKIVVVHSDVLSWAQACRGGQLPWSDWLQCYVELVSAGIESADALVAPTLWMLSAFSANFTLPQHTVVISNGRNVPQVPNGTAHKYQVVSAGRLWDEAKNLTILEDLPSNVSVAVAGTAKPESTSRASRVKFCGKLSEHALLQLFQASAIYVCPSIYEPFGLAPIEAALCGCTVVANDIPSLREVWGDGALFFRGLPQLTSIVADLSDPERLRQAQCKSYARARLFTAERMTERYINLFERLIRTMQPVRRSAAYAA